MRRGHGGSEAAAVPGDDCLKHLAIGEPAPGVDEVMRLLQGQLTSGKPDKNVHWVFLTGGPGNGKSYQVEILIKELDKTVTQGGLGGIALRTYPFKEDPDWNLNIINDATIRARGQGVGDLAYDIRETLKWNEEKPSFLVVNINRGILIEELNRLGSTAGWEKEKDIIQKIHENGNGKYYKKNVVELNDRKIYLHAVYLDQVSLLEKRPSCQNGTAVLDIEGEGEPAEYKVMRFEDELRLESPSGKLLTELVKESNFEGGECKECSANQLCPFLINARNLRGDKFRLGFLKVLRGLEIVSGHLITYRDLWGLLGIAILGKPREQWHSKPCEWVCQNVAKWRNEKNKISLFELYSHRTHEALFSNQFFTKLFSYERKAEDKNDFLENLKLDQVDPAIGVNRKWAQKPSDALEGMHLNTPPSKSDSLKDIQPYWSPLDDAVESSLIKDHEWKEDDISRRYILHWWGCSIYRFYGLLLGMPANHEVIKEWLRLRRKDPSEYSGMEDEKNLSKGLTQLICPSSGLTSANNSCLIPIFHHRSEPIRGETRPTWVYKVSSGPNRPTWYLRFQGDAIWIDIKQSNRKKLICSMLLDFSLCREAMASANGAGFTEVGDKATPRLERARAALIADPQSSKSFGVAAAKFHLFEDN